MNLRFLTAFAAVADAGSISAAARSLGVSATTVAEQIAVLETHLATKLVIRQGRGTVLTDAGRAVLQPARDVVSRMDEIVQLARADHPRGTLKVGAISTAMVSVMPAALKAIADAHPDISLRVYPGSSASLHEQLEQGKLDCVVTGAPPYALTKAFHWDEIRAEKLVLLESRDSPARTVEEALSAAPFIRMDRTSWTGHLVTRFLDARKLRPREILELDAPDVIVELVARGVGVSLLPDWGFSGPASHPVRKIPIGDASNDRHLGVISLRTSRRKLMEVFIRALKQGA